ncbi:stromal membrane-associated protein 1-like isoform X2 [Dunckerocampus dactyliophorus]|uniref:stromal membrane-associated protein 1-like isoform X2 n=1 Tax=Dunckerocampus dactyliophorus TaxID=161453 RepID=UPI00240648AC|nr:stromal membrane-associated protein 1-like isoform X2 [Dunckerocampus dactyliophorus]
MTTRSEREKAQKLNEHHQAILSKLLREDGNKYCADCEAKGDCASVPHVMAGPRWASWNLGVFMCIRCAGIHRNLGVHISRVKSVNLDQWTSEQIQSIVDMGNSRAKQLYEAHLPENFSRPQTDQAVEVFIRDKYERKKYYDKEALPTALKSAEDAPHSNSPSSKADRSKQQKEHEKKKDDKKKEKDLEKGDRQNMKSESRASPKKSKEAAVDLLGLDAPDGSGKVNDELDIFGPMVSNPLPSSSNTQQAQSGSSTVPQPSNPSTSSSSSSSSSTCTTTKAEEKKLLSKDSILSLYASSSVGSQPQSQQQPATGQGMYMGQPQVTQQSFNPATMMGGGAMMSGVTLPNGSYMGMQQNVMAANQGQNIHSMQQGQWSVGQLSQQMSGMATSAGVPPAGVPTTGWPAAPAASGQTLSTQLWK